MSVVLSSFGHDQVAVDPEVLAVGVFGATTFILGHTLWQKPEVRGAIADFLSSPEVQKLCAAGIDAVKRSLRERLA